MSDAQVIEYLNEFRIRLTMHLLQLVDTLDAGLPGAGLKAETLLWRGRRRCSEVTFNDGRKLQEIAAKDELDAAERAIIATNVAGNGFDFLGVLKRLLNKENMG